MRWAVQSASTTVDDQGNVIAFEGVVYDITDRVREAFAADAVRQAELDAYLRTA